MVRALLSMSLCMCAGVFAADVVVDKNTQLCSIQPPVLVEAVSANPDMKAMLDVVMNNTVAVWYTDRGDANGTLSAVQDALKECNTKYRVPIVVYGLPNKDCEGEFSNSGNNKDSSDYESFLNRLTEVVGTRNVLYVVEPDALGLLSEGKCGSANGYLKNLQSAVKILSVNYNALVYLDLASWALSTPEMTNYIAAVLKGIASYGNVRGITLNTSNYRATDLLVEDCTGVNTAYKAAKTPANSAKDGSVPTDIKCIFDTSRNWNGAGDKEEWCNYKGAGIGLPPSRNVSNADIVEYYIWIKPPGESDGECTGRTKDAMEGPAAGSFFRSAFVEQWNNGYFVAEKGSTSIESGGISVGAIVGVSVGVVVVLVAFVLFAIRARRRAMY